jgi:serine/threonine protein kinase/tetratricopeptide (TPR) repeat protein
MTSCCSDQRRRWLKGDRIRVEAYLVRQPALAADREALLDLIYNEIVLREQHGERAGLEEYVKRFPQFADELGRQFEVHRAIERAAADVVATAATLRAPPLPPRSVETVVAAGTSIAGYEVLNEVGSGAMGTVYRARQGSLNRCVALKFIRGGASASAAARARFRREAEAAARLQHSNIVQIHAVGEHDGLPFLSLELVNGPSLAQAIDGRRSPPEQAVVLVETLARAMAHAHQNGVVHRDLKPGNILLQISDCRLQNDETSDQGRSPSPVAIPSPIIFNLQSAIPKITDFGVAKLLDGEAASASGELLGTPRYMAPEQAAGRAVGPAADVYSLGAILYELLTGRPPFTGATVLEILHQVGSHDPVPPRRLRPQLPRDLETICLKCLEKRPERRYAAARELADDLHRFLAGEPIHARPAGRTERVWKWARRRPAAAALVVVSCVALAATGLLGLWHPIVVRDREEQSRAEERQEEASRRQAARTLYQQFIRQRDDALFYENYGTVFADADWSSNVEAAESSARAALALAGITPGAAMDLVLDARLSDHERREIRTGCYQMFLVLSEASAAARPGQPPEEQHRQARRGLELLEQAQRLALPGPAYHRRRAAYLSRLGDEVAAGEERARAANLKPASALDYFLLAYDRFRQGDYAWASRDFGDALRLQPGDFWSHFFLACCHLQTGALQDADANLAPCLAQRPRFVWSHLLLLAIHEQSNRLDEAQADFQRVLALAPNEDARWIAQLMQARVANKQGSLQAANEQIQRVLAGELPARVAAVFRVEHGRNLYLLGKYADAVQECDAALQALPGCADGHRVRGQALLKLARPREAAQAFDRYLACGGKAAADLLRERGAARFQAGDYLGARDDYTRALDREADAEIYLHRGWAYYFADAYKPALSDFDEAVRRDPHDPDAHIGRGLARAMLGGYRDAVRDAGAALRRKPRTPEMMHNVACVYALAVSKMESDPAAMDRPRLAAEWGAQAVDALRATLAMLPAGARAQFWKEKVSPDRALDSLRNRSEFRALADGLAAPK